MDSHEASADDNPTNMLKNFNELITKR
jgi:hypothetical protein